MNCVGSYRLKLYRSRRTSGRISPSTTRSVAGPISDAALISEPLRVSLPGAALGAASARALTAMGQPAGLSCEAARPPAGMPPSGPDGAISP